MFDGSSVWVPCESDDMSVSVHCEALPGGVPAADETDGQAQREVVVEIRGVVDIANAAWLREQLAWALSVPGPRLVFDCSGLKFCDLAGLDALNAAERGAHTQGRSVRWSGQSRQVAWLLKTFPPAQESPAAAVPPRGRVTNIRQSPQGSR